MLGLDKLKDLAIYCFLRLMKLNFGQTDICWTRHRCRLMFDRQEWGHCFKKPYPPPKKEEEHFPFLRSTNIYHYLYPCGEYLTLPSLISPFICTIPLIFFAFSPFFASSFSYFHPNDITPLRRGQISSICPSVP